jgi:hypothetical protein
LNFKVGEGLNGGVVIRALYERDCCDSHCRPFPYLVTD